MNNLALQDIYAKKSICFGCGPANKKGLQIKSIPVANTTIANWTPSLHHEAFHGILNGGIIGTLLDCHSNWTAAWQIMKFNNKEKPSCCVTAEYTIKLLHPCPADKEIRLIATPIKIHKNHAHIAAELWSEDKKCASSTGVFVAVKESHPAFHQWD